MITSTVIILLELLFRDGTSHPVKATSGSLAVSGCCRRYGNSAQCFAALLFPSLHAEAAPQGGIFTLGGHTLHIAFFQRFLQVSCCLVFLSYVSRHASPTAGIEFRGIPGRVHRFQV